MGYKRINSKEEVCSEAGISWSLCFTQNITGKKVSPTSRSCTITVCLGEKGNGPLFLSISYLDQSSAVVHWTWSTMLCGSLTARYDIEQSLVSGTSSLGWSNNIGCGSHSWAHWAWTLKTTHQHVVRLGWHQRPWQFRVWHNIIDAPHIPTLHYSRHLALFPTGPTLHKKIPWNPQVSKLPARCQAMWYIVHIWHHFHGYSASHITATVACLFVHRL